jgi:hypothetical protein
MKRGIHLHRMLKMVLKAEMTMAKSRPINHLQWDTEIRTNSLYLKGVHLHAECVHNHSRVICVCDSCPDLRVRRIPEKKKGRLERHEGTGEE